MRTISLNGTEWTAAPYWQHQWRWREAGGQLPLPTMPPVPATVPGAVHEDLCRAGVIADWQSGLHAFACEWVNNRDWYIKRSVTVPEDFTGRLTLECDGLDYSGSVLINSAECFRFEGTHFRHRFDLTGRVKAGETFELGFIFDIAPQVDGVFGFTSRTRIFKPRFGYCWDWCKRVVNVGIWQDIRLVSRGPVAFTRCRVLPRVNEDLSSGSVRIVAETTGGEGKLAYALRDESGGAVAKGQQEVKRGSLDVLIPVDRIKLWWPATHGEQPLYDLTLELLDGEAKSSDAIRRTIGFKRVRWLRNEGSAPDARPYLCEVNGREVRLRGVNWVPLSPLYGTVSRERYRTFVRLYRNMNVNILRVWGGAILERPEFYEQCDREGLLVWQEFPLSSSGVENWPPEDPEVIEHLQQIATEYIERRCHHACHLLWCGGNELQGGLDGSKTGMGRPVDESHPLMRRWQELVEKLDPGKRFLTSSPSGPRFYAAAEDFGKGLHHQTHGPWGNVPLADRFAYFNGDDSLFRSETGAPGCASLSALERYKGDQSLWPPRNSNAFWRVPGPAWTPWDDVAREFGPIDDDPAMLPLVVKASRYLQAESYRYIAEAMRRRWPQCSGFIIWMGHDSMFCPSNNSVIEIDGGTKPAYDWLQRAYGGRHVSLRHDSIHYAPGERITGEVWVHCDGPRAGQGGTVRASLRGMDGRVVESAHMEVTGVSESLCAGNIDWRVPEFAERLFVVELVWEEGGEVVTNRYLLSQQAEHPLGPMLDLRPARLAVAAQGADRVSVANTGATAAVAVRLVARPAEPEEPAERAILTRGNNAIVFPGESCSIGWRPAGDGASCGDPGVECFNGPVGG